MKTIKELVELAHKDLDRAYEGPERVDVIQVFCARAQAALDLAKIMQGSAGNIRDVVYKKFDPGWSSYNSEGLKEVLPMPFGALIVLEDESWSDSRGNRMNYPPRADFAIKVARQFQEAGWDVRVMRMSNNGEFIRCKDEDHRGMGRYWTIVGTHEYCERCCQPWLSRSESEPSHSATEG